MMRSRRLQGEPCCASYVHFAWGAGYSIRMEGRQANEQGVRFVYGHLQLVAHRSEVCFGA